MPITGIQPTEELEYGSGHKGAAVLLPGFAIIL